MSYQSYHKVKITLASCEYIKFFYSIFVTTIMSLVNLWLFFHHGPAQNTAHIALSPKVMSLIIYFRHHATLRSWKNWIPWQVCKLNRKVLTMVHQILQQMNYSNNCYSL